MTATIQIPQELLRQADEAAREAGFPSTDEFVTWVVADKLRDLRREHFQEVSDRVRQGLSERGHSPEEVLEDFERFRRS